jgi:cytochrome c-type biogenesis protein CcmH
MAPVSQLRSRLPSASTLILIAAGLIAAVSAAIAVSRASGGGGGDSADPLAKDWRMAGWGYAQSGDAAEAFEEALKLNPSDPRARYFLAAQKDLRGDHKGAVDAWLALLRDTPAGAPWEADLRRNIEQVASRNKIDLAGRMPQPGATAGATAAIPGPSPEQLAAASSIPPGQQDQMVQAMVQRLADRLKADPKDADGWIRMMRSQMVLGDKGKAGEALKAGMAAFEGDNATQGRLKSAAAELGVPSS